MKCISGFSKSKTGFLGGRRESKAWYTWRYDMKCWRRCVGRVEEAVEDIVDFHETAGPAMDKKQRNGVSAIGAVVDEVKRYRLSIVRVRIQRDCGCELLVTMDIINPNRSRKTQYLRLRMQPD